MAVGQGYRLKPMHDLTPWTVRLAIGLIAAKVLLAIVIAMTVLGGAERFTEEQQALLALASGLCTLALWISGIVSLFWIYGAAQNACAMRRIDLTPGWAVGWFFIPIANLFKPFMVMRDIWFASGGRDKGTGSEGFNAITGWWVCQIAGNILTFIGSGLTRDGFANYFSGLTVMLAGLVISTAATGLFVSVVRRIHAFQVRGDTRSLPPPYNFRRRTPL
jgi:hypothetical protein